MIVFSLKRYDEKEVKNDWICICFSKNNLFLKKTLIFN